MYPYVLNKFTFLLILVAFIAVSFLEPTNAIVMQTNSHGQMSGCIFTSTGICNMTPLEHVAAWEAMFTAIPAQTANALLLLILIFAVATVFARAIRSVLDSALDRLATLHELYVKHSRALTYISPIQEALSQGILNPKTY